MNLLWILLLCMLLYTVSGFMMRYQGHSRCRADEEEPWSYREKNGPKKWGQRFPACNGREQSPIDIRSYDAIPNNDLPKLAMKNYNAPVTRATIENNGRTIEMIPSDGVDRFIFVNNGIYRLSQIHFHFGDTSYHGSEHTINGVEYSMEMHLVHQSARRETAVVAVFFQEQAKKNTELQNIVALLPKLIFNGTRSEIKFPLNLNNLLPANPSSYYRYQGSLTTPPCDEGVTWSVLTMPLPVGKDQMKEFRKLFSVNKYDATMSCKLADNFRPVQPLNRRSVYLSQ